MASDSAAPATETATFAAGCFWGVEELFRTQPGVLATAAGYTGGTLKEPIYEVVSMGATGHAEAVQIECDPARISYEELLQLFWENHNPTTKNRQGPDIGSQYRSAIFYHSPEQKRLAEESRDALERSGRWKSPIVTEILPAATFWAAEQYHQKYLFKRGMDSCSINEQ